jgi:hypothetical protein
MGSVKPDGTGKKIDKLARMERKIMNTVVGACLKITLVTAILKAISTASGTRAAKKLTAKGMTEKDIGKAIAGSRKNG